MVANCTDSGTLFESTTAGSMLGFEQTTVAEIAARAGVTERTFFRHYADKRDVFFAEGPIDVLDHASQAFGFGGKLGVDATRKWKDEGFTREWPEVLKMDPAVKARVDAMLAPRR